MEKNSVETGYIIITLGTSTTINHSFVKIWVYPKNFGRNLLVFVVFVFWKHLKFRYSVYEQVKLDMEHSNTFSLPYCRKE